MEGFMRNSLEVLSQSSAWVRS